MQLLLTKCLTANQHSVTLAASPEDAKRDLGDVTPDMILVNASDAKPAALLSVLRENGLFAMSFAGAPVIMLDRAATPLRRVEALAAGARDLLAWPVNQRLLLARLRGVLREVHAAREVQRRDNAAARFGFSEDAPGFAAAAAVAFVAASDHASQLDDIETQGLGGTVRRLTPEEAIGASEGAAPIDAFVVDGTSLSMSASFNTLPELRARAHSRHAAILFVHDAGDPDIAASALDSGASDVIANDALAEELVLRTNALILRKQEEDALRRTSENTLKLAVTDPLTGLYNRRYAQVYLQDALSRTDASGTLTVMIVDIDHFKRINDTHGHAVGDAVLTEVSRRMRATLRAIDMVARFGGEEFLIVLPGTEMAQAGPAADRLRRAIGARPISLENGQSVRVTVSIGVSICAREAADVEGIFAKSAAETQVTKLLEAADKALYRAKETGRNRVTVAEGSH